MKSYNKLDQPAILEMLFHPHRQERREQGEAVDVDVTVDENICLGCRFHLNDTASPTIIYFHGNGESVTDYDAIAPDYLHAGINLFVATYRGYGWSDGTPTVTSMMSDCVYIWKKFAEIKEEMELQGSIFIMGRSLGSAAAIELCYDYPEDITGLILESGFADTLPLLQKLGLSDDQGIEEADGFGNIAKIEEIKLPTLILHGSKDQIIPVPQAEKLQAFSGAKAKKFFVIPGADHNSMLSKGGAHYFTTIKDFMDDLTGQEAWRRRRKTSKEARQNDK
jgi:alpha-beta hydrolase superfamily lysophospholipase